MRKNISIYAYKGYLEENVTEIIAECFSTKDISEIHKIIISLLEGA